MNVLSTFSGGNPSLLSDNGINGSSGLMLFGMSCVLHLLFLVCILFLQGHPSRRILPPAIQVNLVSFNSIADSKNVTSPSSQPAPVKKAAKMAVEKNPEVLKKTAAPPEKEIPLAEEAEVSIKPKPVDTVAKPVVKKKSLKKKTYQPEKILDNARKSIEETVEQEKKDVLSKALSRLQEQVKTEGGRRVGNEAVESGPSTGQTASQAIDLYNLELMYRIQQNWAFNERLAGADKNIEVRILVKILKNGQLRDIWFETRSGNKYLDDSALKAVKKSTPFPTLPKGYQFYDVGLIFTPSGLK